MSDRSRHSFYNGSAEHRLFGWSGSLAFCTLVLLTGALTMYVAYMAPMHSDDYGEYGKILTFEAVSSKYLNWSGRLIADTLSPLLVKLPHLLTAVLTTVGLITTMYTIATMLPDQRHDRGEPTHTAEIQRYLIIFSLYWIFSPTLGQTAFWVVGSANYLWPGLFCLIFMKYSLRYAQLGESGSWRVAAAFAFFAGCSNENTSVAAGAFIFLLTACHWRDQGKRGKLLVLLALCGIGAAIMLLAPGNFKRAAEQGEWLDTALVEKIKIHFLKRFKNIFKDFWPVLLLTIFLAGSFQFSAKNSGQAEKAKRRIAYGFLGLSLLAASVLVAAPFIRRPSQIVFILALCSFASLLTIAGHRRQPRVARSLAAFTVLCMVLFAGKYYFTATAYSNLASQAVVRSMLIEQHRTSGSPIELPDFYYTKILSRGDKLDTWTGYGSPMAHYYKVPGISFFPASFNYGLLASNPEKFKERLARNADGTKGITIKVYFEKNFAFGNSTLIIGLEKYYFKDISLELQCEGVSGKTLKLHAPLLLDGYTWFGTSTLKISRGKADVLVLRDAEGKNEWTVRF